MGENKYSSLEESEDFIDKLRKDTDERALKAKPLTPEEEKSLKLHATVTAQQMATDNILTDLHASLDAIKEQLDKYPPVMNALIRLKEAIFWLEQYEMEIHGKHRSIE